MGLSVSKGVEANDFVCDLLPSLAQSDGGTGGIRTHEQFPVTRFPGVLLRPLGHRSMPQLRFASIAQDDGELGVGW